MKLLRVMIIVGIALYVEGLSAENIIVKPLKKSSIPEIQKEITNPHSVYGAYELKEKRTMFSKTFRNEDGTYTAQISAVPIHYFDEIEGIWKEIRFTLEKKGDYYVNKENIFTSYFPEVLKPQSKFLFISPKGDTVSLSVKNLSSIPAKVLSGKICYNISKNENLIFKLYPGKIKIYIYNQKKESQISLLLKIRDRNNSFQILKNGKKVKEGEMILHSSQTKGDSIVILGEVTIDAELIASVERYKYYGATYYGLDERYVGRYDDYSSCEEETFRGFVRFDVSVIPDIATINTAKLWVWVEGDYSSPGDIEIYTRKRTVEYDPNNPNSPKEVFNDIGDGTIFATTTFSPSDSEEYYIELNQDGVNALQNSLISNKFRIGFQSSDESQSNKYTYINAVQLIVDYGMASAVVIYLNWPDEPGLVLGTRSTYLIKWYTEDPTAGNYIKNVVDSLSIDGGITYLFETGEKLNNSRYDPWRDSHPWTIESSAVPNQWDEITGGRIRIRAKSTSNAEAIDETKPSNQFKIVHFPWYFTDGITSRWQTIWSGSAIHDLEINPEKNGIIFLAVGAAGGGGAIFRSIDFGNNFSSIPQTSGFPFGCITISPSNTNIIYAGRIYISGSEEAIWKSTDGGASFYPLSSTSTLDVSFIRDIAVHPANPNIVYAIGYKRVGSGVVETRVYKTTDGGNTWVLKASGLPTYGYLRSISISPVNPEIIYLSMGYGGLGAYANTGVWKTTDAGNNWFQASGGLIDEDQNIYAQVFGVVVDPYNPDIAYATISYDGSGEEPGGNPPKIWGIYKTTNGGTHWHPALQGIDPNTYTLSIDIDKRTGIIIASANGDPDLNGSVLNTMWFSINGGKSWIRTSINMEGMDIRMAKMDPKYDSGIPYKTVFYMCRFPRFDQYGKVYRYNPFDNAPSSAPNLSVASYTSNSISLTWNQVNEALGYTIYYKEEPFGNWNSLNVYSQSSYTLTNLPGEAYSIKVRPYNFQGNGPYSNTVFKVIKLYSPTNLSAESSYPYDKVILNWDDNSSYESSYEIYRKSINQNWHIVHTTGPDETSWTDNSVERFNDYFYKIRAKSGNVYSEFSSPAWVTTSPVLVSEEKIDTFYFNGGKGNKILYRDGVLHTVFNNQHAVYYSYSEDNGLTWSEPERITDSLPGYPSKRYEDACIEIDNQGRIWVFYEWVNISIPKIKYKVKQGNAWSSEDSIPKYGINPVAVNTPYGINVIFEWPVGHEGMIVYIYECTSPGNVSQVDSIREREIEKGSVTASYLPELGTILLVSRYGSGGDLSNYLMYFLEGYSQNFEPIKIDNQNIYSYRHMHYLDKNLLCFCEKDAYGDDEDSLRLIEYNTSNGQWKWFKSKEFQYQNFPALVRNPRIFYDGVNIFGIYQKYLYRRDVYYMEIQGTNPPIFHQLTQMPELQSVIYPDIYVYKPDAIYLGALYNSSKGVIFKKKLIPVIPPPTAIITGISGEDIPPNNSKRLISDKDGNLHSLFSKNDSVYDAIIKDGNVQNILFIGEGKNPAISKDSSGNIYCVWSFNDTTGLEEIRFSRYENNTWITPIAIYNNFNTLIYQEERL